MTSCLERTPQVWLGKILHLCLEHENKYNEHWMAEANPGHLLCARAISPSREINSLNYDMTGKKDTSKRKNTVLTSELTNILVIQQFASSLHANWHQSQLWPKIKEDIV